MNYKAALLTLPLTLAVITPVNSQAKPKITVDTNHHIEDENIRIYGITCSDSKKCLPQLFVNMNCKTFETYQLGDDGVTIKKRSPHSKYGEYVSRNSLGTIYKRTTHQSNRSTKFN